MEEKCTKRDKEIIGIRSSGDDVSRKLAESFKDLQKRAVLNIEVGITDELGQLYATGGIESWWETIMKGVLGDEYYGAWENRFEGAVRAASDALSDLVNDAIMDLLRGVAGMLQDMEASE